MIGIFLVSSKCKFCSLFMTLAVACHFFYLITYSEDPWRQGSAGRELSFFIIFFFFDY